MSSVHEKLVRPKNLMALLPSGTARTAAHCYSKGPGSVMARFRWGILGTGAVARKFALGLQIERHEAEVTVIASRSLEKVRQVGQALAIGGIYGSYEEAVQNADVDAFYIATPPSTHRDLALLCLKARRPVLVEKPFALDAGQARDIIEAARASGVFCMEAMWTRFLPLIREAKRRISEGALGDIHTLIGSFGAAEATGPENNLFSAALGGGALLDRGVYPISLAISFSRQAGSNLRRDGHRTERSR